MLRSPYLKALLPFAFLLAACSGEVEERAALTGAWCGKDVGVRERCEGDEIWYVELQQSSANVTGQWCESFTNRECYAFTGSASDDSLTLEIPMNDVMVMGSFERGKTLRGQLNTEEYGAIPVQLFKVE